MVNDIRRWCRSCGDRLTDGRRTVLLERLQTAGLSQRRRIAFNEHGELARTELVNALAEMLSPQRIESYTPEVRGHTRRVLKRVLRTL